MSPRFPSSSSRVFAPQRRSGFGHTHPIIVRKPVAVPPTDSTARLLQKIYVGLKRQWSGGTSRPDAPSATQWRCFERAAKRLKQAQATGFPVTPAALVWACFQRFGLRTWPQHLPSDAGWTLLCESIERREHIVDDHPNYGAEYDTLSHLAATRGEPLQRVWKALRRSGLFSDGFVRQMDREFRGG